MFRQRIAVFALACATLWALPCAANGTVSGLIDVCDNDDDVVLNPAVASIHILAGAEGLPPGEMWATGDSGSKNAIQEERVVLPCSFVDSGVWGPACADADVYVVTSSGVLLCEIDWTLAMFSSSSLLLWEEADCGLAPQGPNAAAGVFSVLFSLTMPVWSERAAGLPAAMGTAQEGHSGIGLRPS